MLTVTITIAGDKDVVRSLKNLGDDLNDWRDTLTNVGDYLMDVYGRQAFATEGAILGQRWPNLSQPYLAWKSKHYPQTAAQILVREGTLKGGFQKNVGATELEIKNPIAYAIYHQQGRGVPERQIVGTTGVIEKKIVQYFITGVSGKIRKAFA